MRRNEDGSNLDEENNVIDFTHISFKSRDKRFRSQRIIRVFSAQDKSEQTLKRKPCTVLVTLTGVLVSTGTKTAAGALWVMSSTGRILLDKMQAGNPEFVLAHVKYVNAPCSGQFPYRLDLDKLQDVVDVRYMITYEMDVFPGARIRRACGTGGVMSCFKSGAFICVGAPTTESMEEFKQEMFSLIAANTQVHIHL